MVEGLLERRRHYLPVATLEEALPLNRSQGRCQTAPRLSPSAAAPPNCSAAGTMANARRAHRRIIALAYLGGHPGACNSEIAEGAGIRDPGQISRLMRRAEELGLAVNGGDAQAQGGRHAWYLTADGRELVDGTTARGTRV